MSIKGILIGLLIVSPFWALVAVGVAHADTTTTTPLPDSAVGKHESVRPSVRPTSAYWLHGVKLKHRPGTWSCLVRPNHKRWLCYPEKIQ